MQRRVALLVATRASTEGGPAAVLELDGTTVLGRLLVQLRDVGVTHTWVLTRPAWGTLVERAVGPAPDVTVVSSADPRDDLEAVAAVAREAGGALLLGAADVVVHQRPLAVLLTAASARTSLLVTTSRARGRRAFRVRSARGRLVSAESAYHRISRPTAYQLGLLAAAPADLEAVAGAAAALAGHVGDPVPPAWDQELDRKAAGWREALLRSATPVDEPAAVAATETGPGGGVAVAPVLDGGVDEHLATRVQNGRDDVLALLTVGLVRGGVHVSPAYLRGFVHARPRSSEEAAPAREALRQHDEERLVLDAAVKASDGFFTTFFVSPYSRYLARFAARRGWTPNAITMVSAAVGVLAAAAFAVGSRAGSVAGAVLLQAAFTLDCVDGQLARYTLNFSKLGAWLDSLLDRVKEYVVYAGLAIGAAGFGEDVWVLAAAALALQTFRHTLDFSFAASRHALIRALPRRPLEDADDGGPGAVAVAVAETEGEVRPPAPSGGARVLAMAGALDRWTPSRWARRIFLLPIGERFALISLTAALATPRVTFIALLGWGGVTATYAVIGRILRSGAA